MTQTEKFVRRALLVAALALVGCGDPVEVSTSDAGHPGCSDACWKMILAGGAVSMDCLVACAGVDLGGAGRD